MRTAWISLPRAYYIQRLGELLLRYGLVLILVWIGGMKFTAFEAAAIQPLVASSPLMSWMYLFLSPRAAMLRNFLVLVTVLMLAVPAVGLGQTTKFTVRIENTSSAEGIKASNGTNWRVTITPAKAPQN